MGYDDTTAVSIDDIDQSEQKSLIHWSIDYQQDVRGKVVWWLGWGDQ